MDETEVMSLMKKNHRGFGLENPTPPIPFTGGLIVTHEKDFCKVGCLSPILGSLDPGIC